MQIILPPLDSTIKVHGQAADLNSVVVEIDTTGGDGKAITEMVTTAEDGNMREMTCLPLHSAIPTAEPRRPGGDNVQ